MQHPHSTNKAGVTNTASTQPSLPFCEQVEALSALKRLQELLQEGAEPFAKRVMLEISNPDIKGREATHDDAHASTPLLREIQEGAELIRVEVT